MARRSPRWMDLRHEVEAAETREQTEASGQTPPAAPPVVQRLVPEAGESVPVCTAPLTDAAWGALVWEPLTSLDRWRTQVEIRPGESVVLEIRHGYLQREAAEAGPAGMVRSSQPVPEELLRIQQSLEIIDARFLELLALHWKDPDDDEDEVNDDESDEDEVEEGTERKIRAPKAAPTLPAGIDPQVKLVRIGFGERWGRTVLDFRVELFGIVFLMSVDEQAVISRESSIRVSIDTPSWGAVNLRHEEQRRRDNHSFEPSGYFWEANGLTLCPQADVEERERTVSFGEALQRMPTLLVHAQRIAKLDQAELLPQMVRYMRADLLSGPWWHYPRGYYDSDDLPELEDGEAWSRGDEIPQIEGEDETDGPLIGRWKVLLKIISQSGGPGIILFADGSCLLTAFHRTSFKSDVFVIELAVTAGGHFRRGEVHIVYSGD